MPLFTNIAAYKFARLSDLKPRRERLIAQCKDWELKGTILLSPEGINLFLAGTDEAVRSLVAELEAIPGLSPLPVKFSQSDHQPFRRMLVRIKKEIIAFGVEGIDPGERTSPKLSPRVLKQWLDEGRPVTLLDTRNDYEVKLGTFKGARPIGIDHFRNFPDAVRRLPEQMKQTPIVMFCTGGIRCEKAGPFMEREGFQEVFQLDGGILKYFEECGAEHYDGECFVFDRRVGLDPGLRETESSQCFVCQTPLNAADQRDPRFISHESCPYCFQTGAEKMASRIAASEMAIARAATPLPGAAPYENLRPLNIPGSCDGTPLLDTLARLLPQKSREEWRELCGAERWVDGHSQPVAAEDPVRAGERYFYRQPIASEPAVNTAVHVLYEDDALVIFDKPAPLPVHSGGRYHRNTLQFILDRAYAPQNLRPIHRLDANTSGVLVCARTRHFARLVQKQFTAGEVEKTYLARVQGWPAQDEFACDFPISDEPSELGARVVDQDNGREAHTEFSVRMRLPDGTALIEARPRTGRTNQIRIHLWESGTPVVGDPAYRPGHERGRLMTLAVRSAPMCLHAWRLAFRHPVLRNNLTVEAPIPRWLNREITD